MADHQLSSELHAQLNTLLANGSLTPPPIRIVGDLSPSVIEETMDMHRRGLISGEKLIFRGLS
ncbi:hypothetical protein BJX61DRAFT_522040 [Aspergillus egyptiacus]|nr:hypothetical protein BJX61DRAFT_522040 [Aspergillus egyptiacus]